MCGLKFNSTNSASGLSGQDAISKIKFNSSAMIDMSTRAKNKLLSGTETATYSEILETPEGRAYSVYETLTNMGKDAAKIMEELFGKDSMTREEALEKLDALLKEYPGLKSIFDGLSDDEKLETIGAMFEDDKTDESGKTTNNGDKPFNPLKLLAGGGIVFGASKLLSKGSDTTKSNGAKQSEPEPPSHNNGWSNKPDWWPSDAPWPPPIINNLRPDPEFFPHLILGFSDEENQIWNSNNYKLSYYHIKETIEGNLRDWLSENGWDTSSCEIGPPAPYLPQEPYGLKGEELSDWYRQNGWTTPWPPSEGDESSDETGSQSQVSDSTNTNPSSTASSVVSGEQTNTVTNPASAESASTAATENQTTDPNLFRSKTSS